MASRGESESEGELFWGYTEDCLAVAALTLSCQEANTFNVDFNLLMKSGWYAMTEETCE